MITGLGLDQLRRHPDAVAGFPQAAFEDVADAKLPPNLLHIDCVALVGEAGIPGDHEQRWVAGQRGDDVLGDPIGEELLLGVVAHVGEREHGDRRLVRQGEQGCAHRRRGFGRGLSRGEANPIDMNGSGDVLEAPFAHIVKGKIEPTGCVFLDAG